MAESEIAVDPALLHDDHDDNTAYESDIASYTTSLASSVTDFKFENGRRYHAYKDGSYALPNDEKEADRLDIMHKMVEVSMSGKLHYAPLANPGRILDIGTGTGIWAIEMGDLYPQAEILGNDLSPIQPRWVPPNVRFEVDDVEAEWTYSQPFDFIFCRMMYSGIKDFPRLMRQAYKFTKPGGYCEFIDVDMTWVSPDNSVPEDSPTHKANRDFLKACDMLGQDPNPGPKLEGWMKEIGFKNVTASKNPMPVGMWPANKRLKEVGAWNYLQANEGLEAFFTALFTRVLGYTKEEVDVICAKCRVELKNPRIHFLWNLYIVYGQKPEE